MVNYLIRRFFQMILVVFLSTLAIYVLLNVAPGGPLSGMKLSADRKSRVSDADIARIESYLGLDKPLALRYIVWLIGDDWLGSDYVYAGVTPYRQQKIGKNGEPLLALNKATGEMEAQYDVHRFWSDPGVALINPGYKVWVWGEQTGDFTYSADQVRVKPLTTERPGDDVTVALNTVSISGRDILAEDLNGNKYTVTTSADTTFIFPLGEADSLPSEGTWLNVGWLFGADGLLGSWTGYHGTTRGILRLDFGFSWKLSPGQPVINILSSRLGNTIFLMTSASVLSLLVSIPIGIYSAVNQYSRVDYAVTTFAFFGSAMPVFWFGLMMILLFSLKFKEWGLPFFPSGGTVSVRAPEVGSMLGILGAAPGSLMDRIVHIFMPTFVLSLLYMAGWSRFMRTSMLEVLRQDYVRTARAKGLLERIVIIKHAARNALIPIVTIIVFEVPNIFSGAILTETIFSFPGMGRLYFDALGAADWPIVMVILFISAVLVVIATLVRDVLYTIVDPRIKFS
jgi:peptide/nickel transport system permease protein